MKNDEKIDIVDENDRVVASVWKSEAHEKGLLHRTVIAEVIDSKGNWTLVKQSSSRQDAFQFVSPIGGHVASGETEVEALKREAYEEYGLNSDFEYKLVGKKIFYREVLGRKENHYFILYEIYTDVSPVLNEESTEFEKFTPGQLKQELAEKPDKFGEAFIFIINNFYNK